MQDGPTKFKAKLFQSMDPFSPIRVMSLSEFAVKSFHGKLEFDEKFRLKSNINCGIP